MSIVTRKFAFQLKNAPAFFFKLCWDHPIVSALLCSSGFFAVLFPNVFKSLIVLIPLLVSTVLFLAALYSVGPQATGSMKKVEKASAEDAEPKEFELKQLNVISREGEYRTADCKEETETEIAETIQEQNFRGNIQETSEIKNEGISLVPEEHEESAVAAQGGPEETRSVNEMTFRSPLEEAADEMISRSPLEEAAETLHMALHSALAAKEEDSEDGQQKPTQTVEINNTERNLVGIKEHEPTAGPEEAVSVSVARSRSPLDVFIQKIQEGKELVPVEHHKVSSGTGTEEEDEGNDKQLQISGEVRQEEEGDDFDIPLMNFFSMPLKSSWTRFDSSSDSISEASSLGNLGPLFDDLDPLLLTEEDDDPKASITAHEDEERRIGWTEEDDGYENLFGLIKEDDSDSSSEENLIEIELPQQQLLSRSEQELRLLQRGATEELNLIDLDYSDDKEERLQDLIDFFSEKERASSAPAFPEEENLIEIDLLADALLAPTNEEINQFDSVRNKEKVSSFQTPARKEDPFTDLLSELSNHDHSYKTQSRKNVCQPDIATPFVPSKYADLSDLNYPSIKEMNMVGLGDEKSKPEKTEASCGEPIHIFDKEIQQNKVLNLLD
ncbi:hypothetical protein SUGI_0947260 [Cryptomeria japonica]|nr:hypothetical protein SUGI_0947260 [Cryptomeria japonica]